MRRALLLAALLLAGCWSKADTDPAEAPAADPVPAWAADAIAYRIAPERLRSDGLQGVIGRLDDLQRLGVNTLHLGPVLQDNHADPRLGPDPERDRAPGPGETGDPASWRWTAADSLLLDLLAQAHARGLRVVIDGAFAGSEQRALDAAARWTAPEGDPSAGVDGWQIGEADEAPAAFWAAWNARLRSLDPEVLTLAEGEADFLRERGFSASTNQRGFAEPVRGYLIEHAIPVSRFGAQLDERREEYPGEVQRALQNVIGSPEAGRLAEMTARREPVPARYLQRLVALFQMTYVGVPVIYDRDEAAGGEDLRAFYRDLVALRREHEALRRGGIEIVLADDDLDLFAFARALGDEVVVVLLNRSAGAQSLRIEKPHPGTYELALATNSEARRVQNDPTGLVLEVAAHSGFVLRRAAP